MSQIVSLAVEGGIARIVIDSPPVNALSQQVRIGLVECFEAAIENLEVDAIVLTCAGKTFIAGADLTELGGEVGEPGYYDTYRLIERCEKPVVAAMHGTALGGGLELALACHFRVADPSAKMGFPEINLGLVPGAGGTQRLPRLVGPEAALKLFLSGVPVDAATALELGVIDAVADGELLASAEEEARRLALSDAPPRRTCDISVQLDETTREWLDAERLRVKTEMPAREVPAMDIDAVEAALSLPFEEGLKRERIISDASLETTESFAMRRLFFAERKASKIPGVSANLSRPIESGGIVGAGTMGRGIAIAFANSGLPVVLLDVDQSAVKNSLEAIRLEYEKRVARGRMDKTVAEERIALIRGGKDYSDLQDADVVIEAVFESMALKQQIFSALDEHCKDDAILATNTSTLDIGEIASATRRPQDVVGLHFFSPAQVTRLLEVVRSDLTSEAVLATAMSLAGKLRKIGVLSANEYGFIGNRMMDPYGREAERLLLEGATPHQVDQALENFGMAMGILAVFDMAGVDVGVRIRKERADLMPDDPSFYKASALLVENGMLGQKSGAGYYRYEKGSRKRLDNPAALELFAAEAARLGIERRQISEQEIVQRCVTALINEGARVLEEGVALNASDVDVVYTAGYGFPRYRGGPMFYADTVGLPGLIKTMEEYARTLDPQYWQPSQLLLELARKGGKLADFSTVAESPA